MKRTYWLILAAVVVISAIVFTCYNVRIRLARAGLEVLQLEVRNGVNEKLSKAGVATYPSPREDLIKKEITPEDLVREFPRERSSVTYDCKSVVLARETENTYTGIAYFEVYYPPSFPPLTPSRTEKHEVGIDVTFDGRALVWDFDRLGVNSMLSGK